MKRTPGTSDRTPVKRWLVRAAIAGAILASVGLLVAASGVFPVRASSGHWAVTEWLLRFAMKRSVATHSWRIEVPSNLGDPALILKGATHYDLGCRSCHGEPGLPRPRIASHMLPPPPDLGQRVPASNPRQLYYAVRHGLKFTGMPAWPAPQREDEVWAVVAFLLQYPKLSAPEYRRLVGREPDGLVAMEAMAPATRSALIQSCMRCHGSDGLGRGHGAFPILASQRAAYLHNALDAYAKGRRYSGIMEPVAAALTPDVMQALASYYAQRPRDAVSESTRPRHVGARERGEAIATRGIPAQRIPACIECHGPQGRRAKPEFPLLAGQPAPYLELQLTLFQTNRRGGSAYEHVMRPIAAKLTAGQIRDVSTYFASLPLVDDAAPQIDDGALPAVDDGAPTANVENAAQTPAAQPAPAP